VSTHYSEDELTLYYYGEAPSAGFGAARRKADIEGHLQECSDCARIYREISGTLAMVVAEEAPERGERYGLEVWQRIRHRLPEPEPAFKWFKWFTGFKGFGFREFAAAAVVLMIAAFVAGRVSMNLSNSANLANPANPANSANSANPANPPNSANLANPGVRLLVSDVADHLERSERMLTDIMNTSNPGDISMEQGWAEDLLSTSRLYRQDATEAGEQSIATILDDLERNLLEIVHSPSKISAADLEQLRRRIDAAALLFKVRVMSEQLRDREADPADRQSPRASTSKIS
jgi:hypothetical protein